MELTSFEKLPGGLKLEYEVSHSTPGKDGTTLTAPLTLFIREDKSWCVLKTDECEGATHDEALQRMAAWLRRLADGIEKRREKWIPI